ncbi:MAG: hypothetical protein ACPW61_02015 [Methyloligella sp. ZOD6]
MSRQFRTTQNRIPTIVALMLTGAIASGSAYAADPCKGVEQTITDAKKREYSQLVAKSMTGKVKPSQVGLSNVLESGSWSAVYASTPVADDGVFFFQNKKNKDVWGGWADPSERPELIDWAKQLGAPDDLARCFAQIVTE